MIRNHGNWVNFDLTKKKLVFKENGFNICEFLLLQNVVELEKLIPQFKPK